MAFGSEKGLSQGSSASSEGARSEVVKIKGRNSARVRAIRGITAPEYGNLDGDGIEGRGPEPWTRRRYSRYNDGKRGGGERRAGGDQRAKGGIKRAKGEGRR